MGEVVSVDDLPKIIAIANQKGGVGKTTTTINLGAALAEQSYNVLIVDLDPQGNASTGLGVGEPDRLYTSYDLLLDRNSLSADKIFATSVENVSIIPATSDLASADMELLASEKRSTLLRQTFLDASAVLSVYDYILIDCPPSLSLLTINALVSAHSVLVPLQAEFFALEGLSQLLATVKEVRKGANPALRIEGVVLTMFDARNNLAQQVEEDARLNLGDLVFQTKIPRNVRLSEAPSFAIPVLTYDTNSRGAEAYRSLTQEIMKNNV